MERIKRSEILSSYITVGFKTYGQIGQKSESDYLYKYYILSASIRIVYFLDTL